MSDRSLLHTARIPVRWADQDALGHVNNAAYLTFFEQARIEWLTALGGEGTSWPGASDAGPVLVAAEVTFKKPVVYPATVLVDVLGDSAGRSSVPIDCVLRVEGDDAVYATARTTLVWIDRATGRPSPLPDALRDAVTGEP